MRLINTKIKLKLVKVLMPLSFLIFSTSFSTYACEVLKFDKATIWIENDLKIKKKFLVELAENEVKRKSGLQCRKKMAKQTGMLFLWEKEGYREFWMKKTFIPLDIIFIDAEKKIFNFHLNAIPLNEMKISSSGKAKYVLELNSGEFKKLDLGLGDKLIFESKNHILQQFN